MLEGKVLDEMLIEDAATAAADLIDPDGDLHATAEYRRFLARMLALRVLKAATEDALKKAAK